MIYSIDIEFMEELLPDNLDWRVLCPQLVIFYGWLHKQNCLDTSYRDTEPYLSSFEGLENSSVSMPEFVDKCLDGELTDECIVDKCIKEFFIDYSAFSYTDDLLDFFKVKDVYSIPQEWNECKPFYEILDQRFSDFENNIG